MTLLGSTSLWGGVGKKKKPVYGWQGRATPEGAPLAGPAALLDRILPWLRKEAHPGSPICVPASALLRRGRQAGAGSTVAHTPSSPSVPAPGSPIASQGLASLSQAAQLPGPCHLHQDPEKSAQAPRSGLAHPRRRPHCSAALPMAPAPRAALGRGGRQHQLPTPGRPGGSWEASGGCSCSGLRPWGSSSPGPHLETLPLAKMTGKRPL